MGKGLPIFRYVIMNLDLNYAYQIETNKWYAKGDTFFYYDVEDRKTYKCRVLIFEGTVYNKSKAELKREAEAKANEIPNAIVA